MGTPKAPLLCWFRLKRTLKDGTMQNNIRFDLSDYLIHFFRDVDQDSPEGILFPEHARFNNIAESQVLDSLFLMRCALRHHKIFAKIGRAHV